MKKNYYTKNRKLVKSEVLRAIKNIENFSNTYYENYKTILKEKVRFIEIMISENRDTSLSQEEIIDLYEQRLNKYKWDDNTGYFYIFDEKGIILYHGNNKNIKNKNIFNLAKK